jgi:hypothetical protein
VGKEMRGLGLHLFAERGKKKEDDWLWSWGKNSRAHPERILVQGMVRI